MAVLMVVSGLQWYRHDCEFVVTIHVKNLPTVKRRTDGFSVHTRTRCTTHDLSE